MVDQAETPQILDEIAKASSKADVRPRNKKNARRRFIIVSVFFLVILALVSYLGWQQSHFQQNLVNLVIENQELKAAIESQESEIALMQEEIFQADTTQEVDQNLALELERLRQQFDDLQSQRVTQNYEPNFDWKISEAEFYVRMANQKLQLQGDIAATITLIENADIALVDSGNNNVFFIREALASSLAELRGVEVIDREGLFIRLGHIRNQVEQIKLLGEQRGNFKNQAANNLAVVDVENNMTSALNSLFNFFSSAFVFRKWEDNSELIFAAGQPDLIRQNIYMMLEQARFAVIAKNNLLYQQSIASSKSWLEKYGTSDPSLRKSVMDDIEALASIDIDPPAPNLNESLRLINQLKPVVTFSQ